MTNIPQTNGIAIALAWPQTFCKQAGAWYDPLMNLLKISKNNYYKVGHAALVLIQNGSEQCHYFDFGRYHAPKGFGRVRSKETDYELELKTIPKISGNELLNYSEILTELQGSDVFHGDGDLHASYIKVNFSKAFQKATEMQVASPIIYGPFVKGGTNCSRFVSTVIQAGLPLNQEKIKIKLLVPFTPSPASNVKALPKKTIQPKPQEHIVFCPQKQPKSVLKATLQIPNKPINLPATSQWLSGEGSGSWFTFKQAKKYIIISRYSPKGILECTGNFVSKRNPKFNLPTNFKVTHLSHCQQVTISTNDQNIVFSRVDNKKVNNYIWKNTNNQKSQVKAEQFQLNES